jgi:hypothetical protein
MLTPALSHSAYSYGVVGNGLSAGRSMLSKSERRLPSSFWKGRPLSFSRRRRISSFNSPRLKNV